MAGTFHLFVKRFCKVLASELLLLAAVLCAAAGVSGARADAGGKAPARILQHPSTTPSSAVPATTRSSATPSAVITFVFGTAHGVDTIINFQNATGDQIDLTELNLSGFSQVTARQVNGNVEIDLWDHGGGMIILQDFDLADLDASDFIL